MNLTKLILCSYLILLSVISAAANESKQITTINVLSVPETSLLISELARKYAANNKTNVLVNFDTVSNLITDIEEGLPADLIITPHDNWLKELKQKGLIDVNSTNALFTDKLVFISSNSTTKFPRFSVIENYPEYKLIINDMRGDSLSLYTKEVISRDPTIMKLSNLQLIKTTSPVENLLSSNEKFFSINFYSSVFDNSKYKIIGDVEKESVQEIAYKASIIASENKLEAEKLLNFLKSQEALEIYKKYGFFPGK